MFTHDGTRMWEKEKRRERERGNKKREGQRNTFNKHLNERPSEVRFIFGLASHSEEAVMGGGERESVY